MLLYSNNEYFPGVITGRACRLRERCVLFVIAFFLYVCDGEISHDQLFQISLSLPGFAVFSFSWFSIDRNCWTTMPRNGRIWSPYSQGDRCTAPHNVVTPTSGVLSNPPQTLACVSASPAFWDHLHCRGCLRANDVHQYPGGLTEF